MISVNKKELDGIIFKISDYKDSATKLTILTKDGFTSLIVRGGKKYPKLNSLNQLFTYCHFVSTNDKLLNTLTDGEVINNYTNIKVDSIKSLVALSIFEYIQRFHEGISEFNQLYQFVLKIMDLLNNTNYPNVLLMIFEIKFWYLIGIQPRFDHCSKCNDEGVFFSVSQGGVVCGSHLTEDSVSMILSKTIYLLYYIKPNLIDEKFLSTFNDSFIDLEKIISDYYLYYFEFTNQNKKLLLSFIK